MEDKLTTRICSHCERAIPLSNIDLHSIHCSRYLEKCKICGDVVPKKHAEEHFSDTHAPLSCSGCGETVDRHIMSVHKAEKCPQRSVVYKFCEFPLPAIDLPDHQDLCGNKTDLCYKCNKYIRRRELVDHESQCKDGWSNSEADRINVPYSCGEEEEEEEEEEDYYPSDIAGWSDEEEDPIDESQCSPTANPEETETEREGWYPEETKTEREGWYPEETKTEREGWYPEETETEREGWCLRWWRWLAYWVPSCSREGAARRNWKRGIFAAFVKVFLIQLESGRLINLSVTVLLVFFIDINRMEQI